MNWLIRIAQQQEDYILSFEKIITTRKLGEVKIRIETTVGEYSRWNEYTTGSQGWNDRQTRSEEGLNRRIEMEPDCRLTISHEFSEGMPPVEMPQRTPYEREYEMDAFDIIGDQMENLKNDNYAEVVKIRDVYDKIQSWFFLPIDGHYRVDKNDRSEVDAQMNTLKFSYMEELFQQWVHRPGEIVRKDVFE